MVCAHAHFLHISRMTEILFHFKGMSDYAFVSGRNGSLRVWLNRGKDAWEAVEGGVEIVWGIGDNTYPSVILTDLNGDGRDDYIGKLALNVAVVPYVRY